MVFEVFQILSEQVNAYFQEIGLEDSQLVIDNIALAEGTSDAAEEMRDRVVLTLVNLHEEGTMKNQPNHHIRNDQVQYRNRVIHLHLFFTVFSQ